MAEIMSRPFSEQRRTNWEDIFKDARGCENCKHTNLLGDEFPCSSCVLLTEDGEMKWESMEKKANPIAKE